MKPEKAKPKQELKKIMEEKDKNLFIICERCRHIYEDIKNVPIRCTRCGCCLLCEN